MSFTISEVNGIQLQPTFMQPTLCLRITPIPLNCWQDANKELKAQYESDITSMTSPLDNGCHGDDEEDENLLAEYESDDETKEKDGKVGDEGDKDEEEEHVTKVLKNVIEKTPSK